MDKWLYKSEIGSTDSCRDDKIFRCLRAQHFWQAAACTDIITDRVKIRVNTLTFERLRIDIVPYYTQTLFETLSEHFGLMDQRLMIDFS